MPLEEVTQDVYDAACALEGRIRATAAALETRIDACRERIVSVADSLTTFDRLDREVEGLRRERQKLLASGDDHSEISGRIQRLHEQLQSQKVERELLQDEKTGLEDYLEDMEKLLQRELQKLAEAGEQVMIARHLVAANEYNAQARQLAEVVKKVWETQGAIPEEVMRKSAHDGKSVKQLLPHPKEIWYNTALWSVPILRKEWEKGDQEFFFLRPGTR